MKQNERGEAKAAASKGAARGALSCVCAHAESCPISCLHVSRDFTERRPCVTVAPQSAAPLPAPRRQSREITTCSFVRLINVMRWVQVEFV